VSSTTKALWPYLTDADDQSFDGGERCRKGLGSGLLQDALGKGILPAAAVAIFLGYQQDDRI
jgi:hypothetical protein